MYDSSTIISPLHVNISVENHSKVKNVGAAPACSFDSALLSAEEFLAAERICAIIGDHILDGVKNAACGDLPQITVEPVMENFGAVARVHIAYNNKVSGAVKPGGSLSCNRPTCDELTLKSDLLFPAVVKGRAGIRPQLINFRLFAFDNVSLGSIVLFVGMKRRS